ncbi:hypothetical protein RMR16_008645 [Agrobacterium sp. rho-13.3]|uniref:hypothetical protein n=1 Tax=Agrobacterium sp. rho-13.3 TaxID=3072980 RepID=UPI002A14C4FB|nr:hypothetical protein [Agrobacterium sp. rho-13.3]MDX8310018.1 hypothetical protein [Agrobacterium sp. rho-13.3]
MRRVSLNARLAQDAQASAEIYVALFQIEHPELEKPIRLSTDNTERLSSDPLYYGTRSTWRGANPIKEPFLWIVASAVMPSDLDDAPATASLVLENLDQEMVNLVRSFTTPASIHMAVVMASSANLIEAEFTDLNITSADINAGEISLSISREEIELEYVPGGRMTARTFPGLHR